MKERDTKYFRAMKVHQLGKEDYELLKSTGMFYEFYPEACGIYEEDILISGTYGQDNPDGVGWPYEMGDEYMSKVSNVTKDHLDSFVGNFKKEKRD